MDVSELRTLSGRRADEHEVHDAQSMSTLGANHTQIVNVDRISITITPLLCSIYSATRFLCHKHRSWVMNNEFDCIPTRNLLEASLVRNQIVLVVVL